MSTSQSSFKSSKNATKKIVIIGAGVGALCSAALLAKDGHKVTVVEKNELPGGRAGIIEDQGFRFDTGPSWYLMPEVFDRFFAEFDIKANQVLDLEKPDPQYRVFFSKDDFLDIVRDLESNIDLFESIEKGAGQKLREYLAESKIKYDLSLDVFLYKNMDSILGFANMQTLKSGPKLHLLQSMEKYVSSFFKTQKLQQLIEYTLVFLGGAPHNTPALFSLMSHLDFNQGVLYPKGGFFKVVEAMYQICLDQGVTFHFNTSAQKIITNGKLVTGVKTSKKLFSADVVIGNADYAFIESIIDNPSKKTYSDSYWQKRVLSPSAFVMYLGVKKKFPQLRHHTLFFGPDWKDHFKTIFDQPSWPQSPSLYLNVPSATDSTVAPKNHENIMILVPVAPGLLESESWKEHYGNYILSYIQEKMGVDLNPHIVVKHTFSVSDFSQKFNSYQGNALGGLANTLFQSAVWRPTNKSKKLSNLFFAGANTVPGIGVPPAIISGHLVRDRVRALVKNGGY